MRARPESQREREALDGRERHVVLEGGRDGLDAVRLQAFGDHALARQHLGHALGYARRHEPRHHARQRQSDRGLRGARAVGLTRARSARARVRAIAAGPRAMWARASHRGQGHHRNDRRRARRRTRQAYWRRLLAAGLALGRERGDLALDTVDLCTQRGGRARHRERGSRRLEPPTSSPHTRGEAKARSTISTQSVLKPTSPRRQQPRVAGQITRRLIRHSLCNSRTTSSADIASKGGDVVGRMNGRLPKAGALDASCATMPKSIDEAHMR